MSKKNTKNYTDEFKQSSARLAIDSDQPISATAKELGISPSTLHGWVKKYYPDSRSQVLLSEKDLESENKRLLKELNRVKMERDILKKAAAYFANETL